MRVQWYKTSDQYTSGTVLYILLVFIHLQIIQSIAPTDENEDHTDAKIEELANKPVSHIPKDDDLSASPLDLTQLLLQPLEIIQGELLINLSIIHQPKQFWHTRTIAEFYPLQSEKQRQGIVVQVRQKNNNINIFGSEK